MGPANWAALVVRPMPERARDFYGPGSHPGGGIHLPPTLAAWPMLRP